MKIALGYVHITCEYISRGITTFTTTSADSMHSHIVWRSVLPSASVSKSLHEFCLLVPAERSRSLLCKIASVHVVGALIPNCPKDRSHNWDMPSRRVASVMIEAADGHCMEMLYRNGHYDVSEIIVFT